MKGLSGPKVLVVHPSSNKPSGGAGSPGMALLAGSRRRLWVVVFLACFACVSVAPLLSAVRDASAVAGRRVSATLAVSAGGGGGAGGSEAAVLPGYVFDALVQYAAAGGNSTASMPAADVRAIAAVLKRRAPCNLLVFGLGAETPLWRALNHGGRTVFLDENQYYVSHLEGRHPGLEAYDVVYTTTVREFPDLLDATRAARAAECRPVQNLLFSDCRLAINDLPNQLYDVSWDVILVDGPRGYTASSPGRMAAIFTAGVLARTRMEEGAATDVLVHDSGKRHNQPKLPNPRNNQQISGPFSPPPPPPPPPLGSRGGRRGSVGGNRRCGVGGGGGSRRRRVGLGMRGVHAAPTTAASVPCCGFMDGLLIFVFYLSLPIRGGRDHSLISTSSNC